LEKARQNLPKNQYRLWDCAYDGYAGGKDVQVLDMKSTDAWIDAYADTSRPFDQASIVAVPMRQTADWVPSPLILKPEHGTVEIMGAPEAYVNNVDAFEKSVLKRITDVGFANELKRNIGKLYEKLQMGAQGALTKPAPEATISNECTVSKLAYQGTSRWVYSIEHNSSNKFDQGCGHHGPDFAGVASVRNGKSMLPTANPQITNTSIPMLYSK
jgi:hypothetical protein